MPALKSTPLTRLRPGVPAKSKNINFFFTQDATNLKRKWAGRQDFWNSTRPEQSNAAPRWEAFENWRDADKNDDDT